MTSETAALAPVLLSGLLDALPGRAVLLDRSGIVLAANREAVRATVASDAALEASVRRIAPLCAEDAQLLLVGVATVLEGVQRRFQLEAVDERDPAVLWQVTVAQLGGESGLAAVVTASQTAVQSANADASFRTLFESSLDAMMIADAQGRIVSTNATARVLFDVGPAHAAARLEFGHLFSAGKVPISGPEAWHALLRNGHWRGHGAVLRADKVRVLDIGASAHVTPGRHLITVRDVTESQQMEAQLRQAQKMEAIGLLTGGMAHDFNNLLTVVLANCDMVLDGLPPDSEELRDEIGQIVHAATRGTDMVKKLLAFGRQETLERRPVSLEVVLAESQALLARLLPSNIMIRVEVAPDLPGILADPGAVQHMLLNLATNSRDAMQTGGSLTLRGAYVEKLKHADGSVSPMVTLTVEDTGRGMSEEVLAHLFEPFYTTKAPGEGTGLGMAMIYGLVQQHAGTISVHSRLGQGTTVTIGLPLADGNIPDATPRSSVIVRDGARETILLVEDEEMVRRAGRRILEKHGYHVLQAADGAEALTILRDRGSEIALVVSDVVMPRMGGRELYASLRDEGFRMPFLFTSGYTDRMSSDTVALDPSVPVLPKPWTWTELTASVRAALDEGVRSGT